MTDLDRPASACRSRRRARPSPRSLKKTPAPPTARAERKLLADLETAIAARADHLDYSRVDRELAAAFRSYGLDLDVVDPKTAGARLAGKPETPEIAAAIDEWCRVRRTRLKVAHLAPAGRGGAGRRSRPLAQRGSRSVRADTGRCDCRRSGNGRPTHRRSRSSRQTACCSWLGCSMTPTTGQQPRRSCGSPSGVSRVTSGSA